MNAFRPYHNVVEMDSIPSAFLPSYSQEDAQEPGDAGFVPHVSRQDRRNHAWRERLEALLAPNAPGYEEEIWDDIVAPWAHELPEFSFCDYDVGTFQAKYDCDYYDYLDYMEQARDDQYEYNFRYVGEDYNPYH